MEKEAQTIELDYFWRRYAMIESINIPEVVAVSPSRYRRVEDLEKDWPNKQVDGFGFLPWSMELVAFLRRLHHLPS